MRAQCGCLIEDGMILHGFDGPCLYAPPPPTAEDICGSEGHMYYADDGAIGRCYCGAFTYPLGADRPGSATT